MHTATNFCKNVSIYNLPDTYVLIFVKLSNTQYIDFFQVTNLMHTSFIL